jgi:hypothetical protein
MLEFPQLPGARRAIGVYHLADDLRVLDLDDPAQLMRLKGVLVGAVGVTSQLGTSRATSRRWLCR